MQEMFEVPDTVAELKFDEPFLRTESPWLLHELVQALAATRTLPTHTADQFLADARNALARFGINVRHPGVALVVFATSVAAMGPRTRPRLSGLAQVAAATIRDNLYDAHANEIVDGLTVALGELIVGDIEEIGLDVEDAPEGPCEGQLRLFEM